MTGAAIPNRRRMFEKILYVEDVFPVYRTPEKDRSRGYPPHRANIIRMMTPTIEAM